MHFSAFTLLAITLSTSAWAAAPSIEPGEYEYKVALTTQGLPPSAAAHMPKGATSKICIKAEDLKKKNPWEQVIQQPSCKVIMTKQTASRNEWNLDCNGGMTKGSGWLETGKNSFKGEAKTVTKMPGGAGPMTIISKYDGKRLGACR